MTNSTSCTDWRELYLAAIFESDSSAIQQKISLAEQAMSSRERELLHQGNHDECDILDDCMYVLRVYKSRSSHAA